MPGQSSKTEIVTVRLGTEEFNRLKQQADREGVPLAAVIRRAVQISPTTGGTVVTNSTTNPTTESVVGGYSPDRAVAELRGVPDVPNLRYVVSATVG